MNLQSGKLFLSAVLSGVCAVSAVPVEAGCHGRSGGYSHSSGYSSRVSYHQPVYSPPVVSRPVTSQTVYLPSQSMYGQPQPMPQYNPAQPGFAMSPGVQSQPGFSGQPIQQGMQPHQGVPVQQGIPTQQGLPTQQGVSMAGQTAPVGAVPMPQQGSVPSPNNNPGSNPNNNPASNSSFNDAQQSALQALGGFAPPQETTTAAPQSASTQSVQQPVQTQQLSFTGTWTASLANGARVQLAMQADGSFSWTAINKEGQSSVFQGSYAVEAGSLSLTRSNDGQKLSGTVTPTGTNTFSFQLSVAQSPSLEFVRG